MKPTRRTQPYRRGKPRPPGGALTAILRGRTLHGQNPMDIQRKTMKGGGLRSALKKRKKRRRHA